MPENTLVQNKFKIKQDVDISTNDFILVSDYKLLNQCDIYMYHNEYYVLISDYYEILLKDRYHFISIEDKIFYPDIIICSNITRRNVFLSLNGCDVVADICRDKNQRIFRKQIYDSFNNLIKEMTETKMDNFKENTDTDLKTNISSIISGEFNKIGINLSNDLLSNVSNKIISLVSNNPYKQTCENLISMFGEINKYINTINFDDVSTDNNTTDNIETIEEKDIELELPVSSNNIPESNNIIKFTVTDTNLKDFVDELLKMYSSKLNIDCKELRNKTYNLFGFYYGDSGLVNRREYYNQVFNTNISTIDFYCVESIIADYVLMLLNIENNGRTILNDSYNGVKTIVDEETYKMCIKYAMKNIFKINISNDDEIHEVYKCIKLKSNLFNIA